MDDKGPRSDETPGIFLLGQGPVEQSSTNKPLAMRVVEDALAYSKKPPVIKCRFANRI